ncbi:MAG TPA: hypothetical protein VFJ71_05355 [Candidatus Limnocylindrales bacterium]|nr:hypothetical protein [Candidatus Limnocylindrales bacterium]
MTAARPPDRLDVPVVRLPGGRGGRRRAAVVATVAVGIIGGAFALARLAERPTVTADPARRTGDVAAASATVRPSPTARSEPRVETLLAVARVALPGAPEVTLAERSGDGRDVRVTVWTPDDARTRLIRDIPNILPDGSDPVYPVLAPNRRFVAVLAPGDTSYPDEGTATVVDDTGKPLWRHDRITVGSGALWSADSRVVVVAGRPRQWHIVTLDRAGRAVEHAVDLPREVYLPNPIPQGSISLPTIEPVTIPLGFSEDGTWIYGGVISPELALLIGEFRVSSDGATVERLSDFRVGQPDGLVPRPGTIGTRTVDPVTGRIATTRINADTTGGPRTVEVRAADNGFQFDAPGGVTLGWDWGGGGDLYTLTADAIQFPDSIALMRIDAAGRADPPILTTGPLTGAALIGVRDGYAVVGFLATRPEVASQLVAVDLAQPERITALPDPGTELIAASLDR